jgi:hypothetical protein
MEQVATLIRWGKLEFAVGSLLARFLCLGSNGVPGKRKVAWNDGAGTRVERAVAAARRSGAAQLYASRPSSRAPGKVREFK